MQARPLLLDPSNRLAEGDLPKPACLATPPEVTAEGAAAAAMATSATSALTSAMASDQAFFQPRQASTVPTLSTKGEEDPHRWQTSRMPIFQLGDAALDQAAQSTDPMRIVTSPAFLMQQQHHQQQLRQQQQLLQQQPSHPEHVLPKKGKPVPSVVTAGLNLEPSFATSAITPTFAMPSANWFDDMVHDYVALDSARPLSNDEARKHANDALAVSLPSPTSDQQQQQQQQQQQHPGNKGAGFPSAALGVDPESSFTSVLPPETPVFDLTFPNSATSDITTFPAMTTTLQGTPSVMPYYNLPMHDLNPSPPPPENGHQQQQQHQQMQLLDQRPFSRHPTHTAIPAHVLQSFTLSTNGNLSATGSPAPTFLDGRGFPAIASFSPLQHALAQAHAAPPPPPPPSLAQGVMRPAQQHFAPSPPLAHELGSNASATPNTTAMLPSDMSKMSGGSPAVFHPSLLVSPSAIRPTPAQGMYTPPLALPPATLTPSVGQTLTLLGSQPSLPQQQQQQPQQQQQQRTDVMQPSPVVQATDPALAYRMHGRSYSISTFPAQLPQHLQQQPLQQPSLQQPQPQQVQLQMQQRLLPTQMMPNAASLPAGAAFGQAAMTHQPMPVRLHQGNMVAGTPMGPVGSFALLHPGLQHLQPPQQQAANGDRPASAPSVASAPDVKMHAHLLRPLPHPLLSVQTASDTGDLLANSAMMDVPTIPLSVTPSLMATAPPHHPPPLLSTSASRKMRSSTPTLVGGHPFGLSEIATDQQLSHGDVLSPTTPETPTSANGGSRRISMYGGRRRQLSNEEVNLLTDIFRQCDKPNAHLRAQLAAQMGMTSRAVQIWFQNKRAKRKKDLIEKGSSSLASPKHAYSDAGSSIPSPLSIGSTGLESMYPSTMVTPTMRPVVVHFDPLPLLQEPHDEQEQVQQEKEDKEAFSKKQAAIKEQCDALDHYCKAISDHLSSDLVSNLSIPSALRWSKFRRRPSYHDDGHRTRQKSSLSSPLVKNATIAAAQHHAKDPESVPSATSSSSVSASIKDQAMDEGEDKAATKSEQVAPKAEKREEGKEGEAEVKDEEEEEDDAEEESQRSKLVVIGRPLPLYPIPPPHIQAQIQEHRRKQQQQQMQQMQRRFSMPVTIQQAPAQVQSPQTSNETTSATTATTASTTTAAPKATVATPLTVPIVVSKVTTATAAAAAGTPPPPTSQTRKVQVPAAIVTPSRKEANAIHQMVTPPRVQQQQQQQPQQSHLVIPQEGLSMVDQNMPLQVPLRWVTTTSGIVSPPLPVMPNVTPAIPHAMLAPPPLPPSVMQEQQPQAVAMPPSMAPVGFAGAIGGRAPYFGGHNSAGGVGGTSENMLGLSHLRMQAMPSAYYGNAVISPPLPTPLQAQHEQPPQHASLLPGSSNPEGSTSLPHAETPKNTPSIGSPSFVLQQKQQRQQLQRQMLQQQQQQQQRLHLPNQHAIMSASFKQAQPSTITPPASATLLGESEDKLTPTNATDHRDDWTSKAPLVNDEPILQDMFDNFLLDDTTFHPTA